MIRNNKGAWNVIFEIALALIVFIVVVAIWRGGLFNVKHNLDQKTSCQGAFGIGYGYCMDKCERPDIQVNSTGCHKPQVCCISMTKKDIVELEHSGQDSTHYFTLQSIKFQNYNELVDQGKYKCSPVQGDTTQLVCPPNQRIKVVVQIEVKNGPTQLTIYGNPLLIDSSGQYGEFNVKGNPIAVKANEVKTLLTEIILEKDGTKASSELARTYKIYGVAQSDSTNPPIIDSLRDGEPISITFMTNSI